MKSLEPFLALLATIPDPRRAEGKLYRFPHVLLFSIFAIVSGANSYRGVETYFKVHRLALNKAFGIKWKRAPAHTAIRYILQGLVGANVEKALREQGANLNSTRCGAEARVIAFVLRQAQDEGQGAEGKLSLSKLRQLQRRQGQASARSAFVVDTALAPAHVESTRNPTRSPPRRRCSRNSTWPAASSPATPCTAKKNVRGRRGR